MIWEIQASDSLWGRGRGKAPRRGCPGRVSLVGNGMLCFFTWEEHRYISSPASNISYTHTCIPYVRTTAPIYERNSRADRAESCVPSSPSGPISPVQVPRNEAIGKRRWLCLRTDTECSTGLVLFRTGGKPIKPQRQGALGWTRQNKHPRTGISSSKSGKGL